MIAEAQKQPKITIIPLDDLKPYLCVFYAIVAVTLSFILVLG